VTKCSESQVRPGVSWGNTVQQQVRQSYIENSHCTSRR